MLMVYYYWASIKWRGIWAVHAVPPIFIDLRGASFVEIQSEIIFKVDLNLTVVLSAPEWQRSVW